MRAYEYTNKIMYINNIIPIICTPMMPGVYEEVIGSNIICFILNGKRDDLKGRRSTGLARAEVSNNTSKDR